MARVQKYLMLPARALTSRCLGEPGGECVTHLLGQAVDGAGQPPEHAARIVQLVDERQHDRQALFLDLGRCSPFQRRVLLAEQAIPRGRLSTYGRLARHLGAPRAARAVGGALARNPFPIVIPCHRAIRGDGSVGGFQGGMALKRRLLEYEGHVISAAGEVLDPRYHF